MKQPFVPEIDISEDTEFCLKMREVSSRIRLPLSIVTSCVRFVSAGVWHQGIMNQWLKVKYLMGWNQVRMNQEYESDLQLNGPVDVKEP